MEKGVTEIPSVQPIPTMSSMAAIAQAAPAAPTKVPALTAPPATKVKVTTPKTAPAKTSSKRPAPISKEANPASKRQKIKQSLAIKASRLEEKTKEEEEKKKEAERKEAVRQARLKKVQERATKLLNENMHIQASLMRSGYIPFSQDKSEVCYLAADIEACRITIKEMVDSNRYTKDEHDFIRKVVNRKAPTFNSEQSEKFKRVLKELTERPFDEIEARRANHPDACFIEDFISEELKEGWNECRVKFIKAYYFWKVVPSQDSISKLDALNNFMVLCYEPLWRRIFIEAELAEPKKKIIKIPERMLFPQPRIPNSQILNCKVLDNEIDEALELECMHRESSETTKTMKPKVYSAYIMDES